MNKWLGTNDHEFDPARGPVTLDELRRLNRLPKIVPYEPPRPGGGYCPQCNEFTISYKSGPIKNGVRFRYHKCAKCGYNFQSQE